ncbi:hypothetical protein F8M41_003169 [Gigaspora margarita]|uniref:Uncharacterized protein n=1 Tax=Gigaspora margarita TaxID=4874 RepID=A0A8H4A8N6_GIGMA|nr:hypothetical protein F8M41_003169 [Gigaspora margarita]
MEPAELPEALQDPKVATILLSELKKDMPALVFQWNDAGFNDVPNMPNCRNGIPGQTKAALIANLVANRAVNWDDTIFTFPNGTAIGIWVNQMPAWYFRFYLFRVLIFYSISFFITFFDKGPAIRQEFLIFAILSLESPR